MSQYSPQALAISRTINTMGYRVDAVAAQLILDMTMEACKAIHQKELRQAKETAWDEGFDAGEQDVHQHKTFNEPCIPNPYRSQK